MNATDPKTADRLALEAIAADPDLGPAYALRGRIAAVSGDPVRAAHYFRVAFARGDRSPTTRYGLSVCLGAVGQAKIAARIHDGVSTPADLRELPSLVASMIPVIQQMLASPLPDKGQPALLPNERLPPTNAPAAVSVVRSQAPSPAAAVRVERSEPGSEAGEGTQPEDPRVVAERRRATAGPRPGTSEPRPARSEPSVSSAPRQRPPPVVPKRIVRRAGRKPGPEWLELTAPPRLEMETGPRETWVEDAADVVAADGDHGVRIEAGAAGLELAYDPGIPKAAIRSPVTGRVLTTQDLQDQFFNANMPRFGRRADPMEARDEFEGELDDLHVLRVAVHLPGPVMTGPQMQPRKLCERVALGLTDEEVVLRDTDDTSAAAVRIPLAALDRLEVVGGQQLSLCLTDGRQLHLDLRALRTQSFVTAGEVLERLERAIDHD